MIKDHESRIDHRDSSIKYQVFYFSLFHPLLKLRLAGSLLVFQFIFQHSAPKFTGIYDRCDIEHPASRIEFPVPFSSCTAQKKATLSGSPSNQLTKPKTHEIFISFGG
jgi:hypothetical protein